MALNDNPVDAQIIARIKTMLAAVNGSPDFYYDLTGVAIVEEVEDYLSLNTFPTLMIIQGDQRPASQIIHAQSIFMDVAIIAIMMEAEEKQLRASKMRHDIVKKINSDTQLNCLAVDSRFQSSDITVIEEANGLTILNVVYEIQFRYNLTDPTVVG